MSKNYIINCYTCQHNGQETCKGCNTLLVGENEPYENWELREDLETKDQRIAELEEQLKNAILLPKYEKGQKIYYIVGKNIKEAYFQSFAEDVSAEVILNPQEITDEDGYTDVDFDIDMIYYKNTFATKEEAQAKLEELGENK